MTGTVGAMDPTHLSNTRRELHWLVQVFGAVGDGFLDKASDDSQSTFEWSDQLNALVGRTIGGRARLAFDLVQAEFRVVDSAGGPGSRQTARGLTLQELLDWSHESLSTAAGIQPHSELKPRGYTGMPKHPVATGAVFALSDDAALAELKIWFDQATTALSAVAKMDPSAGELRGWPHHFDIGGIFMLEPDKPFEVARQIGFGWSPGDGSYDQPYYYVTPFPVPVDLPALQSGGHWHREGFTAAVLTGARVIEASSAPNQYDLIQRFLRAAIQDTMPLVRP